MYEGHVDNAHQTFEELAAGKQRLPARIMPFCGVLQNRVLEHIPWVPGRSPGCFPHHQVVTQADLHYVVASLSVWERKAVSLGCRYVINSLQADNHGQSEPVIWGLQSVPSICQIRNPDTYCRGKAVSLAEALSSLS